MSMIPADQARDWRRRWGQLQTDLSALLAPRTEPMDAEAIHAAWAELGAFYLRAYHLKDALRDAAGTGGVPIIKAIESAIDNDSDLALLADLCNQEKHPQMGRAPRSKEWPSPGRGAGSASSLPSDTWRLEVTFRHKGKDCDGLQTAERAVEAWHRWLTAEGLI